MKHGKEDMDFTEHYGSVVEVLTSRGLLLGSYDAKGKPNLMTIGWGTLGSIWSKPIWIVLVRPSRYTYECIEHSGGFTVNVPPKSMAGVCETCGTRSGRSTDKFAACGLTAEKAITVNAPTVAECPIVYECEVVHTSDVLEPRLSREIIASAYKGGDFHSVYWGEILAARIARDAFKALA